MSVAGKEGGKGEENSKFITKSGSVGSPSSLLAAFVPCK